MFKNTLLSFLLIMILVGGGCVQNARQKNNLTENDKSLENDQTQEEDNQEYNQEVNTEDVEVTTKTNKNYGQDLNQENLNALKAELESLQYEDIETLSN